MSKEPGNTATTPDPRSIPHSPAQPGPVKPAAVKPTPIQPASVSLTAKSTTPAAAPPPWWQHKGALAGGFALLLVLLAAVVFLLPNAVEPPAPPPAEAAPAAPGKPIESPWQEAQLAKERLATQDILAEMLKKQEQLEKMQVRRWGAQTFAQAMETAAAADSDYRRRNFQPAQEQYRKSLALFEELLAQAEGVFTDALTKGEVAIREGVSATAIDRFELALAIKPDSEEAQQGLERARVLEQVLAIVKDGQELEKQNQLEQARRQYEQALQLDSASQPAAEKLAAVKQAIVERDFSHAMSEGYAALHSRHYAGAKKAFRRATTLKPDAPEAGNALTQAENQHTQAQIEQLLDTARQKEAQENWAQAQADYERALKLDKSIVNARIGLIRASTRAEMDKRIEAILAEPARLANEDVYGETQKLLTDARALAAPGPRLQRQTEQLARALELAVTPVAVRLQSDNQTDVTLYKVGKLGNFTQREMSLKPGHYTVVGSRDGYRDVREEFSISPGSDVKTIVIQCKEKISLDG